MPISVSAGLIGAINSIFLDDKDDQNIFSKGVQSMAILVPTGAPNITHQAESSLIVDDNALVSQIGPMGFAPITTSHKASSDQISIYVVRDGDTLSQIANMFDVSVNTIKWGNDLTSNTLRKGQNLVILPVSGVKHVVSKGDTLASLVKKYKGDIEEIMAYNDLSKDSILVAGSVVIIPDGEIMMTPVNNIKVGQNSGLKEYVGYYMRPIVGGKKTQGIHGYNGVDLAAPVGTPILAAASGEVIISRSGGWNGGYGNYVVIRHANGTQTLYSHNSKNKVSVGDSVEQGDVIGLVGSSGKATGAHVHFEIRGAKNPF